VLAQAASFALLAAISPTALLIVAIYLGTAEPRKTAVYYLAGAVVMSVITAAVAVIAIRAAGLNLQRSHAPRYGLRLGLGVLALATAALMSRRKPAPAGASQSGLVARLAAEPSPRVAFVAGVLLFAPGVTFIAAVQVIATARAGLALTTVGVAVVVVIAVMTVWLPLAAYLAAPDFTASKLQVLNAWPRAHGRTLAMAAVTIAGVALVLNGALGLAR
jgi:hypothetical protein